MKKILKVAGASVALIGVAGAVALVAKKLKEVDDFDDFDFDDLDDEDEFDDMDFEFEDPDLEDEDDFNDRYGVDKDKARTALLNTHKYSWDEISAMTEDELYNKYKQATSDDINTFKMLNNKSREEVIANLLATNSSEYVKEELEGLTDGELTQVWADFVLSE